MLSVFYFDPLLVIYVKEKMYVTGNSFCIIIIIYSEGNIHKMDNCFKETIEIIEKSS